MWSFFHGWRRKAGVVSLGLALALMIGWMRSCLFEDVIGYMFPGYGIRLTSEFRRIDLNIYWPLEGEDISAYIHRSSFGKKLPNVDYRGPRMLMGFSCTSGVVSLMGASCFRVTIPYAAPTIALTLLSAYLILGSPRKKKTADQPTISNLISN